MCRKLFPSYRVPNVLALTPERLADWGIRSLLLDVDCTLKRYSESELSPEILAWLDSLRTANILFCCVSNGRESRIAPFANRFHLPFIALALKPSPKGCLRAMEKFHFDPISTAMVGDQIFTDILAGNRAGIKTILVTPNHPEEEPWFARIKRPLEKIVLFFDRQKIIE